MAHIKYMADGDNLYGRIIEQFISREFPQVTCGQTENMMEGVVESFLGTKQVRLGPRPSPESLVTIRDVVRRSILEGRPIPVLVASATVKLPLGNPLDLAELSAIRQLACLNDRVKAFYKPGLAIRVRMEDMTELVLSPNVANIRDYITDYGNRYKNLVRVLGYSDFIETVPESSLAKELVWLLEAERMTQMFLDYLTSTDGNPSPIASPELIKEGWLGPVSSELREYLKARYRRLYKDSPESDYLVMMARYFGNTLTRKHLGALGNDPSFQGFLEVSFVPPQPDLPIGRPRVYYRTVPMSQTSLHIPYWNAKGHLRIAESGESRICLASWWDKDEYQPGVIRIADDISKVDVAADYILE